MDGKQRKTLKFKGENLFIEVSQYRSNGRIAILSNRYTYRNHIQT